MESKHPKYLTRGMKFGRLTVVQVDEASKIKSDGTSQKPSQWHYWCECSCLMKPIISVNKNNLVRGTSSSCGCYQKEALSKRRSQVNLIEDCGKYYKVFFNNTDETDPLSYTTVDKDKYDSVKDFGWFRKKSHNTFYAYANSKGQFGKQKVYMHQIICPCKSGLEPDHKDRNGLNNRSYNLHPVTKYQNASNKGKYKNNTSGHTGVLSNTKSGSEKWEVRISINAKRYTLGVFENQEEAVAVRMDAENKKKAGFLYVDGTWYFGGSDGEEKLSKHI